MNAARDRINGAGAAVRACRHALPIAAAGCALVAGVLLLGNPFATRPAPHAPQPQIRLGAAELSLPEPTATASIATPPDLVPVSSPPVQPPPKPAPIHEAAAPVFVVPPAPAAAAVVPIVAPAPTPPVPAAKRMGGGKRATIIVETLPARRIIPPYVPRQPVGATPEPHPPLPLDTEIEGAADILPAASPAPKTAAASLPRNG